MLRARCCVIRPVPAAGLADVIRPVPAAGLADVWWFDVREVSLSRADLADLGPAERETGRGLAFAADRHRYQAAHLLLRRVLSGYTGLPPGQLEFGRERCPRCDRAAGRPVLRGCSGPQFSLSHSGDAVAIAVSAAVAVGIDAERADGGCVCPLAAVMPGPAARQLGPLAEPARHAAILRWWVRAEAVLEVPGRGDQARLRRLARGRWRRGCSSRTARCARWPHRPAITRPWRCGCRRRGLLRTASAPVSALPGPAGRR